MATNPIDERDCGAGLEEDCVVLNDPKRKRIQSENNGKFVDHILDYYSFSKEVVHPKKCQGGGPSCQARSV